MLFLFNICNGSRFPLLFSDIFHNVNRFLFYIFIISIITGFDVSSNIFDVLRIMEAGSYFCQLVTLNIRFLYFSPVFSLLW